MGHDLPPPPFAPTARDFRTAITANPVNAALLDRLATAPLPQGHLVAGCLFQTVWNLRAGRPPGEGIRDYDVFYFDDADPSWDAEDRVIRAVAALVADLGVEVEVRNQARVHLWYESRFGRPRAPLASSRHGIDGFLIPCTCVGIEIATGAVYAPDGFADLWAGVLRPNPLNDEPDLFRAKALSYQARWPWLSIMAPEAA